MLSLKKCLFRLLAHFKISHSFLLLLTFPSELWEVSPCGTCGPPTPLWRFSFCIWEVSPCGTCGPHPTLEVSFPFCCFLRAEAPRLTLSLLWIFASIAPAFLSNHRQGQCHGVFRLFSSASFTVLGLKFKSLICFVLMCVGGTIRLPFYSFACGDPVFLALGTISFPLSIAEGRSAFCVWTYFWPLSVPSIYASASCQRQAAVIPGPL